MIPALRHVSTRPFQFFGGGAYCHRSRSPPETFSSALSSWELGIEQMLARANRQARSSPFLAWRGDIEWGQGNLTHDCGFGKRSARSDLARCAVECSKACDPLCRLASVRRSAGSRQRSWLGVVVFRMLQLTIPKKTVR